MFVEEVERLYGPSHFPRTGTEAGVCYVDGGKERLKRPRVRRRGADGKESEHALASYLSMRDLANNAAKVVPALQAGMSTRSQSGPTRRPPAKARPRATGSRPPQVKSPG